jgi:ERCC4-type nuclease
LSEVSKPNATNRPAVEAIMVGDAVRTEDRDVAVERKAERDLARSVDRDNS